MVSRMTLPTFSVCLHFSKLICFHFFQMYPDVAGDVQSITGESLHAWQREIVQYKGQVVYWYTIQYNSLFMSFCICMCVYQPLDV